MNRSVQSVLLVVLMVVGCKNDDAGTGTDSQTGTAGAASTGTDSSGATNGATTTPTGGGVLTSTEGELSSGGETDTPTTGEVASCDPPESCTAMGGGDLASFTLPFFRGRVCVSDAIQPGDTAAISMSTCVHPCLTVGGFKYKYMYRCLGMSCELALVSYHPDTTGTNCPDDVFGEFPAESCVYGEPYAFTTGVVGSDQQPFAGAASLLVPFMTNADVEAMAGGDDMSDSVWTRIQSHTQDPARKFEMSFAPGNAKAPAACGEGVPGCTCRDIGL